MEVPVVLHIRRNEVGELTGVASFPNTGGGVAQLTAISIDGSKVMFRADGAHATFEGTISQENSVIAGLWTDSGQSTAEFRRVTVVTNKPKRAKPSDIDGYWTGTLNLEDIPGCETLPTKLRYIFRITNTTQGLVATWDTPDNGDKGWIATSVTRNQASLDIEMKQTAARFHGMLNIEKTRIDGTWTITWPEGGSSTYPFVLNRSKRRPKLEAGPEPTVCANNGVSGA
jgi:hypothetical protein